MRDRDAEPDSALGQLRAPLGVQELWPLDTALEMLHESRQHPQVLLCAENLGHPVTVRDAEVPGRSGRRPRLVPARADVAMAALDDQHDLLLAESMDSF